MTPTKEMGPKGKWQKPINHEKNLGIKQTMPVGCSPEVEFLLG